MLLMALLVLLRLKTPFLVGLFVKRRDEVLECSDEVNAEIPLGFVGLLDRFGDILDGRCQALERGMDALETGGNAFEEFGLLVFFRRRAHGACGKGFWEKSGGFPRVGTGFRMVGERFVGTVNAMLEPGVILLASGMQSLEPESEGMPVDA